MGWTPLHHASFFGNETLLDKLLQHGAIIEISGHDGITPMHCAVQSGKVKIVQKLIDTLEKRRSMNTRKSERYVDCNERQPIHWAAIKGDVKMTDVLKDDIDTTDRFGWTPLHLATIYQHENLLRYITQDHAETMNTGDNELRTPLHLAVEYELADALQILIRARAKVNTTAKDGSAPLHVAVRQKQKKILEILLAYEADIEAIDMKGRTALYLSVENGEIETIEALINAGANPQTATKDGRTPLHVALSRGQDGLEVAKILLQAGADANTRAVDGATVLHIAAQCGSLSEILNVLSRIELKLDAIDEYGQTALLIAIYEKEWEAAKLLLMRGAGVNEDKRSGYTPVLGTVMGEKEDILQQLLEKGASVDDVDGDGYSALHLAVLNRNHKIASLLVNAGANINAVARLRNQTPLHIAVRKRNIEIVQTLLERGADTLLLDGYDFSPLQHALYWEDPKMVHILIEHDKISATKAVLQKNGEGDTPLHTLAAWTGSEAAMCEILDELLSIDPGVDINATNREGSTPLDLVLDFQATKRRIFIAKLLDRGAKPSSDYTKGLLEDFLKGRNKEGPEV
jgi:ankyrin repeat protein